MAEPTFKKGSATLLYQNLKSLQDSRVSKVENVVLPLPTAGDKLVIFDAHSKDSVMTQNYPEYWVDGE